MEEGGGTNAAPLLGGHAVMRHHAGSAAFVNSHDDLQKGTTRAAVLGCLDGLVSNLCLILGVMAPCLMGKESDKKVLLTGLAGIFAGAFSMAVGEWLSITAENEYLLKEVETEKAHISEHRDEENQELIEYFVEQGLRLETANLVIADLEGHSDSTARLLNFHTKFHLGIDQEDLGGSAWTAAGVSFLAFSAGGLIPLLPWTVPCSATRWGDGAPACLETKLALTIALSALAMFLVGFVLARSTPTNSWYGGARHTACGLLAAGSTFCIGYGIGSAVG
ncbi:vacuolar iron transporter [Chloropicon primus]|uniref:Vacuolar iron transporter n=1 Tax=Chloropicon primus TaxID=1764295 RepID=A0A5B8MS83_9CHLO|nr:vacuolar iron transporter [Chloropicon primus]UPR01988.1 vacuolar iron transporter [Chloropicon primus]|mmetsp:Transcript_5124/g.15410  ORF Transcript_5124/g.15410 Transcript_5124/m.15410 type:complete len:278 (+) Transcript_5124:162-995(+)|eukprot:QDZ22764.1 vacuolar iron transporter [Chloropicon primus]